MKGVKIGGELNKYEQCITGGYCLRLKEHAFFSCFQYEVEQEVGVYHAYPPSASTLSQQQMIGTTLVFRW